MWSLPQQEYRAILKLVSCPSLRPAGKTWTWRRTTLVQPLWGFQQALCQCQKFLIPRTMNWRPRDRPSWKRQAPQTPQSPLSLDCRHRHCSEKWDHLPQPVIDETFKIRAHGPEGVGPRKVKSGRYRTAQLVWSCHQTKLSASRLAVQARTVMCSYFPATLWV